MNDSYVEWMIARKTKPTDILIKGVAIGLTAVLFLLGLVIFPLFVVAIVAAVLCYFFLPNLSIEYEYLYVSKELQVDKIMSKTKRKTVANYTLDKMEIFAKEGVYQLDEFKNRQMTTKDFTSGDKDAVRYVMIINDGKESARVYLEPNDAIITAIRNQFPRKVFS
ncbi:hypothetical protein D7X88_13595 [bacterium C-53]|nr:hypothetical protein [Lachnospiraceae bacterium]NBI04049.1 hypothetical protein [Lachnospiraceae bacterium]RKJ08825.1 hypothetical protein D7X88_13595 [bacterium C-53]